MTAATKEKPPIEAGAGQNEGINDSFNMPQAPPPVNTLEAESLRRAQDAEADLMPLYDAEKAIIPKAARDAYARESTPPEPIPLRPEPQEAMSYPAHALGQFADAAQAIQADVQVPMPMVGSAILTGLACAVQNIANIDIDGRLLPTSLMCISVAESGDRKTAVDGIATHPHLGYEKSLVPAYNEAMQAYSIERRAYDAERKKTESDKNTDRAQKVDALKELGREPIPPTAPTFILQNVNSEGIFRLFKEGQHGIGLFCDEAGTFFGGQGFTPENVLKTITFFSNMHDGSPIDKIRSGEGSTKLYGRRCSMHLMMQPILAQKVLSDPLLLGQGILGRALVSWPKSLKGSRTYQERNTRNNLHVMAYFEDVKKALEQPRYTDEAGNPDHKVMTLSQTAKAMFISFANGIESQLGEDAPLHIVPSYGAKLADIAVRIAGILTLAGDTNQQIIDAPVMGNAIELAQFYLSEIVRITETGLADPAILKAEKLLHWLHAERLSTVTSGIIGNKGPYSLRLKKEYDTAIKTLVAHGWLVLQGRHTWMVRYGN